MAHKLSSAAKSAVRTRIRHLQKTAKDPKLSRAQFESTMNEMGKLERELHPVKHKKSAAKTKSKKRKR